MTGNNDAGLTTALALDSQTAAGSVLGSSDIMTHVFTKMDLATAMDARAVRKLWRQCCKVAGLEPLEAGVSEEQKKRGLQEQLLLNQAFEQEMTVWTEQHALKIANHMTNQSEITADMRETLVEWLIKVHFNFRCLESSLYLTIQLVNHYMAKKRAEYQTVGVTAFMIACCEKENQNLSTRTLAYITDYSSTVEDIENMEKEIRKQLRDNMKEPTPADFLRRFSQAAKLDSTEAITGKYSMSHSITLFFLDMALLNETLVATRPSLIAAASVMCTLRVLGRRDWSPQLEHYTRCTRDTVAAVANTLVHSGDSVAQSIVEKYMSPRLGGVSDQVGADGKPLTEGCLHVLAEYYECMAGGAPAAAVAS